MLNLLGGVPHHQSGKLPVGFAKEIVRVAEYPPGELRRDGLVTRRVRQPPLERVVLPAADQRLLDGLLVFREARVPRAEDAAVTLVLPGVVGLLGAERRGVGLEPRVVDGADASLMASMKYGSRYGKAS